MTKFIGTNRGDSAFASPGNILKGFTGGSLRQLNDAHGDTFLGRGGDDLIIAGQGNDHLNGGTGNDALAGGVSNDVLDPGTNRPEPMASDLRSLLAAPATIHLMSASPIHTT